MNTEFSEWLSRSDIECNCVPGPTKHGNGLVFGDEKVNLVNVPKDMVISADMIVEYSKDHPLLDMFLHVTDQGDKTEDIELIPRKIIFRFLLYQMLSIRRGTPDLKFASWIRSLPPAKDINLPIAWDDEEIQTLITTSIYYATVSKKKHITKTYSNFFSGGEIKKAIAEYVASGGKQDLTVTDCEVSIQDWLLVDQWISSRSLSLPVDEETMQTVMVPVVDLANHATDPTAVYVANDEGGVSLVGLRHDKGAEVTINYGPDTGAGEFLFKYGFIPEDAQAARTVTFFHDLMDPKFRTCLDEEHDPSKQVDENSDEIDPDSSYEILFALYNERFNRTTFTSAGGGPATWHDDFICLHCCGSDLEVVHDPKTEYVGLHFRNEPVDLSNVEQTLVSRDAEFFNTVVKPRGNHAIINLINKFYLVDDSKASQYHPLHRLEQQLLVAVINEAKKNTRVD